MSKAQKTIRLIVEIGLFAAIGFVLDEIQGSIFGAVFPSGGSIGIAMLAVLIIAYRRGPIASIAVGLIMGLFDMATKAYLYNPLQVLCDYVFPYALVGCAGFFRPLFNRTPLVSKKILWIAVGSIVGGALKLLSHFIAGVTLWVPLFGYSWGLSYMGPYLYSLLYNLAAIGPSIIICIAIMILLVFRAPQIFNLNKEDVVVKVSEKRIIPIASTSLVGGLGLFTFIFFLIKYINSYKYKASSFKYSFDYESTFMWVMGLLLIIIAIYLLITVIKNTWKYSVLFAGTLVVGFIFTLHYTNNVLEMYVEKEIDNTNWIFFSIAFVITALLAVGLYISLKKEKHDRLVNGSNQ